MSDYLQDQGYKKEGKNYIPPILRLGKFNDIDWIDELVPELFWIGLLQEKMGFGNGSNLASELATPALETTSNKSTWFAPVSSFNLLTAEEKKKLESKLQIGHKIEIFRSVFNPLYQFYPEFPLGFLLEKDERPVKVEWLEYFKQFLMNIYDRTTVQANWIQAVAFDLILRTDIEFKIDSNTALAEFPKFQEYPDTEISKQVASSIRAAVNLLYHTRSKDVIGSAWQKYFWNTGFKIDKCK